MYGAEKQCEESTLGSPVKPRGGVPKPFVPHLTPGSSGFVFLLLFKSKTKFRFVF